MEPDKEDWVFPIEKLKVGTAYLCLTKDDDSGDVVCLGFRFECEPLELPDDDGDEIHIDIEAPFVFHDLGALAGKRVVPSDLSIDPGESLGSLYLFGVHNEVSWSAIRFGDVNGERLAAEVDINIDFESDGSPGGVVATTISAELQVEKRWEL